MFEVQQSTKKELEQSHLQFDLQWLEVIWLTCLVPRASYCESKERIKLAVVSFNNELKKRKETLTLELIPWGRLGLLFIRFELDFVICDERARRVDGGFVLVRVSCGFGARCLGVYENTLRKFRKHCGFHINFIEARKFSGGKKQ